MMCVCVSLVFFIFGRHETCIKMKVVGSEQAHTKHTEKTLVCQGSIVQKPLRRSSETVPPVLFYFYETFDRFFLSDVSGVGAVAADNDACCATRRAASIASAMLTGSCTRPAAASMRYFGLRVCT
jgi:hypothetical protein